VGEKNQRVKAMVMHIMECLIFPGRGPSEVEKNLLQTWYQSRQFDDMIDEAVDEDWEIEKKIQTKQEPHWGPGAEGEKDD